MEKVRSNPSVARAQPYAEGAKTSAPAKERRGGARYTVSADAVVVEPRSQTRLKGRAADLSLTGCYLDATNLFPSGTSVGLRLTCEGHSFACEARVAYSLPGMGMGVAFTKISPDQATELRRWIAELSGELDAAAPLLVPDISELQTARKNLAEIEPSLGLQSVLAELVNILRRKGLLDESEAASLRNKLAR